MARTFYRGDINAEYGGYFYNLEGFKNDYADVVRIVPCCDAGGPSNCFWIESVTVLMRPEERMRALSVCGIDADSFKEMKPSTRRHVLIDAHLSYGTLDQNLCEIVRIGKPDQFWRDNGDRYEPDTILRGNASIKEYARKRFLRR